MAKGAKLFEVIYVDTDERVPVLVGIGDTVRATDWADKEYPYPAKPDLKEGLSLAESDFNREEYREEKHAVDEKRDGRAGLYAVFLGAQRGKLRGTETGDWIEWLSLVTMPEDEDAASDEAEAPAAGESDGPQSES
jgi:hypothetical protein